MRFVGKSLGRSFFFSPLGCWVVIFQPLHILCSQEWTLPSVAACQHSRSSGLGSIWDFWIRDAQLVLGISKGQGPRPLHGHRGQRNEGAGPPHLFHSPPQAGRLQTCTVSGLTPSHGPRALELFLHTTCRCWMPSPQVAEHCRRAGEPRAIMPGAK